MRAFVAAAVAFVLGGTVGLAWYAPAQAVLRLLPATGLEWSAARGLARAGSLHGVSLAGQSLGDVAWRLGLSGLLRARIEVETTLTGEVARGRGMASLRPGALILSDLHLRLDLAAIRNLDPRLRAAGGSLVFADASLAVDRAGTCTEASGRVDTDLLRRLADRFGWKADVLRGSLSCVERVLRADLGTPDGATRISLSWSREQAETLVAARVETDDAGIASALDALGFSKEGTAYDYSASLPPWNSSTAPLTQ